MTTLTNDLARRVRDVNRNTHCADLVALEGDYVFSFPPHWPDTRVGAALAFAIVCYRIGLATGAAIAKRAMRAALGV